MKNIVSRPSYQPRLSIKRKFIINTFNLHILGLRIERLKKILSRIPEFTDKISDLTKNDEFKKALDTTGTIGNLIRLTIVVVQEVKKHYTTPEKIAFTQLLEIAMDSAKESLVNLSEVTINDLEQDELTSGLFTYFTQDKWYPYMYAADNRIIERFKSKIIGILTQNNIKNDDVLAFRFRFEDTFRKKIFETSDNTKELNNFMQQSKSSEYANKMVEYLQYCNQYKFHEQPGDDKFLYEYYVPNNAYRLPIEYWRKEEGEIKSMEHRLDKWEINDFLKSRDWYVVIGAPFGIGKSSFSKFQTQRLAEIFLDNYKMDNDSSALILRKVEVEKYMPILISLKEKDFTNVWEQDDLNYVLDIINNDSPKNIRKILCIFDGLDEWSSKEDINKFFGKLTELRNTYKDNMKMIITTRLEADYPTELHIPEQGQFVRLFSFEPEQVDQFFVGYGVSLEYENLMNSFGDVLPKPLFCWMIAFTFRKSLGIKKYLIKDQDVEINKTSLYFYFIHTLLEGRYKHPEKIPMNSKFSNEKSLLRKIAALKQIYQETLTRSLLENEISRIGSSVDIQLLDPIISAYFSIRDKQERVEFLHKSFREYLIAEYYLECIVEDKPHLLDIGVPSEETISFFKDLLSMIGKNRPEQFIDLLANSLTSDNNDLYTVISNKSKLLLEGETVILKKSVEVNYETSLQGWKLTNVGYENISGLWMHRWISLFCLMTIYSAKSEDSDNSKPNRLKIDLDKSIQYLIKYTSNSIPYYLKNFSLANLSDTNHSDSNLSGANLHSADLSGANLHSADLSGASLQYANLQEADLHSADLSGASLQGANLQGANLHSADLSGASLQGANLYSADLSGTGL